MKNKKPINEIKAHKLTSKKDCCESEVKIAKVVLSLVIGNNHTRRRYSHRKGHANAPTNCPCPIPYYKSEFLACTLNTYPEDFKNLFF